MPNRHPDTSGRTSELRVNWHEWNYDFTEYLTDYLRCTCVRPRTLWRVSFARCCYNVCSVDLPSPGYHWEQRAGKCYHVPPSRTSSIAAHRNTGWRSPAFSTASRNRRDAWPEPWRYKTWSGLRYRANRNRRCCTTSRRRSSSHRCSRWYHWCLSPLQFR